MIDAVDGWERTRDSDVPVDHGKRRSVLERLDVRSSSTPEVVETDDVVTVGQQSLTEVAADKAGTACDQHSGGHTRSSRRYPYQPPGSRATAGAGARQVSCYPAGCDPCDVLAGECGTRDHPGQSWIETDVPSRPAVGHGGRPYCRYSKATFGSSASEYS
jgi:hypothetical protein